jgi:hypothetical protein
MDTMKIGTISEDLMMSLAYSRQVAGGHVISQRTRLVSSTLSPLISLNYAAYLNRNKVNFTSSVRLIELPSDV